MNQKPLMYATSARNDLDDACLQVFTRLLQGRSQPPMINVDARSDKSSCYFTILPVNDRLESEAPSKSYQPSLSISSCLLLDLTAGTAVLLHFVVS